MSRSALEILRYGVNGFVATAVHYAVLTFNWYLAPMNFALNKVFNKVGDAAIKGLRKVLA